MGSAISCAKCCSVLSFTGIIFLCIIGALLQSQPMYIKGIDDPELAASGCYGGAGLYCASMVLSLGYWYWYDSQKSSLSIPTQRPGNSYGAVSNPINS